MKRIPTTQELAEHARQIARAFNVALTEVDILPYEAGVGFAGKRIGMHNAVLVRTITDTASYVIALHELGHLLHPSGSVRDNTNHQSMTLSLIEEEAAWEWARHHALDWTMEMESVYVHAIATYHEAVKMEAQERVLKAQKRAELAKRASRPKESIADFLKRRK